MHTSVLLNESVDNLCLSDTSVVVDCTLGYAGHSSYILSKIPNGFLYAFDQDEEAVKFSFNKLQAIATNYEIINKNFSNMKNELEKRNVFGIDAILFDLGVSSPQLDEADRGFSFHKDAVLDMRMDKKQELSAYEVVNNYKEEQLVDIFKRYGEEKYAFSIARKIVKVRALKPIRTTLELVSVIQASVPFKYSRQKHPGRKIFQAIRIEVNDELNVFEVALKQALEILNVKGRICVITFHSLEDKICKRIFKEVSEIDKSFKNMPVIPDLYQAKFKVINSIVPSSEELLVNSRSRSAKLRIIERIKGEL